MTVAFGVKDELLKISCRPAEFLGTAKLPSACAVVGVDSGEKHSNKERTGPWSAGTDGRARPNLNLHTGSDYACVRVSAFMARRMLQKTYNVGAPPSEVPGAKMRDLSLDDDVDVGLLDDDLSAKPLEYLTEIPPHVWDSPAFAERLPPAGCFMEGKIFLSHFADGHGDEPHTKVHPDGRYDIAGAGAHPVYEHHRCRVFAKLALAARAIESASASSASASGGGFGFDASAAQEETDETLALMGELMYQSHAAYSRLGLGSDATDTIVRACKNVGPNRGVFGAKITGGGRGGVVAVLLRSGAAGAEALELVRREVASVTGKRPRVFEGSSDGAVKFGALDVVVLPAKKAGEDYDPGCVDPDDF